MSQIEVLDSIDYITEAFQLLNWVAEGGSILELRDSLSLKYDLKSQQFQKKMKLIDKVIRQAQKSFENELDLVRTYFLLRKEGEMELRDCCVADCVLLRDQCYYEDTLEEAMNRVLAMDEKTRCELFESNVCGIEEVNKERASTPIEVVAVILEQPDIPEVKLKLQEVLMNQATHLEIIRPMLEKAIGILKKNDKDLEAMVKDFQDYWIAKNQKEDFFQYIEKSVGIDIGKSENGTVMIPSIIALNIMSLSMEFEEAARWPGQRDVIRMGIIFDDEMKIGRKSSDVGYQDYALQVLKLLSDKSKFDILNITRNRPYYGSELAKELNLTTATISHHVNALVGQGVLEIQRKDGEKRIYYSANQEKVKEILDYLGRVL